MSVQDRLSEFIGDQWETQSEEPKGDVKSNLVRLKSTIAASAR